MLTVDNLPLNELEKKLIDTESDCYIEKLLDVVSALIVDCQYPSGKNSRGVQSFIKTFNNVFKIIESRRTKYSDFDIIKVIGQGGFGRVELVRHKRTRRVYAIKLMNKQHLLDHSQSGFWEERDIMVKASNEWLVACHYAFMDKENVYLCMEYMPGGDLYYWLEKYDTFDELTVCFYLAEATLALEALHNMGFIHRDLKPDNMLLDSKGHLKLADFGSCVKCDSDGYYYCTSPTGTPDYISPEMLNCQAKPGKISAACDWWAVGVIAYEMLFGEAAFYGQSLVQTYSRILNHEKSLTIPTDEVTVTAETVQFIKDLLKADHERLGSLSCVTDDELTKYDYNRPLAAAQHVKAHPFFKSIQWVELHSQEPPIKPTVNSETDTSNINFDQRDLSSDGGSGPAQLPHSGGAFAPTKPPAPTYFTGSNLSFAGYTFNRYHKYFEHLMLTDESSTVEFERHKSVEKQKLAESNLQDLKQSYHQLECQSVQNEINLKDLTRRLTESLSQLDQLTTMKMELEKSNADLQIQLNQSQASNRDLEYHFGEVQRTLDCEQTTLNDLKKDKFNLMNQIEALEKCLNDTRDRHKESIGVNMVALDPSIESPDVVRNLELHIQQLELENREARDKASVLISEASNLRRNHNDQVNELNAQLQSTQRLNHNLTQRIKEFEEQSDKYRLCEEALTRDLNMMRENLEASIKSRRAVEDQLVTKESALAVAQVKLRNLELNLEFSENRYEVETSRLSTLNEHRLVDLTNVSEQLDAMRVNCARVESENDKLTDKIIHLEEEKGKMQRNMQAIVEKLYSEVENRYVPQGNKAAAKKATVDRNEYRQLEKKFKNMQSTSQKEIADLHGVINQCKKDLADQSQINKSLTDEIQAKYKEINILKQLERCLRSRLDFLVPSYYSTPVKSDHNKLTAAGGDGDSLSADQATSKKSRPSSPSASSLVSLSSSSSSSSNLNVDLNATPTSKALGLNKVPDLTRMKRELLNIVMEEVLDLEGKGRSKHKLKWLPKYAVLKPFVLVIYESHADRDAGAMPEQEISLAQIIHVREVSELDLIHAKKDDIKRTIQLFVRKPIRDEIPSHDELSIVHKTDNHQIDSLNHVTHNATSHQHSRSSLAFVNLDQLTQHPPHWNGHEFHSIRFRRGNILCDICHKVCSDLLNPPEAMECINCKLRIHSDHVDKHEKIAPCDDICYIRMSSSTVKRVWIDHLNALRSCLRECQNNPEQLADVGLVALAHSSGGVANIGLTCGLNQKHFNRTVRAGSMGPGMLHLRPTSHDRSDSMGSLNFQSSFKRLKSQKKKNTSPKMLSPRTPSPAQAAISKTEARTNN